MRPCRACSSSTTRRRPPCRRCWRRSREGVALVEGVELVVRPALSAGAADLLAADGVLLGTPANIGYMSGALKHFFDTVYYPCLDATVGLPYGVYVHGDDDTAGALTAIEKITGALRWKQVAAPLSLIGAPGTGRARGLPRAGRDRRGEPVVACDLAVRGAESSA